MTVYAYNSFFKKELEIVATYGADGQYCIYKDAIPSMAKVLQDRIRRKYQNVVVFTGGTGSGKSTAAIHMARAMDRNWIMEPNYIYGVEDLKRKLGNPYSSPISLFDEGSVALNSGNSLRKEDKQMVVLFDTMRSLGWTSLICIPSLISLNKRIREYHIDYLCICPAQSPIPGYDPRGMLEIYEHRTRDWAKPYFKRICTTLFPPLKGKVLQEYEQIKKAHQMQLIRRFIEEAEE